MKRPPLRAGRRCLAPPPRRLPSLRAMKTFALESPRPGMKIPKSRRRRPTRKRTCSAAAGCVGKRTSPRTSPLTVSGLGGQPAAVSGGRVTSVGGRSETWRRT